MQDAQGQVHWKRPYYGTVYKRLTHPVYGGAYVYGRREKTMEYTDGQPRHSHRKKPRGQWLSLIPNNHEGYVSWEQFEKIQAMIRENNRGPVRPVPFSRDRHCWEAYYVVDVAVGNS